MTLYVPRNREVKVEITRGVLSPQ